MRSIDDLKHEHRVIELVLNGLEKLAGDVTAGHQLDRAQAAKALEIIRNFADRCHHGKEEQHLFEWMAAQGMPKGAGPLGVMLFEHGEGRKHVRAMTEAAAASGPDADHTFAEHAQGYVALLRAHIQKEDNVLYPMAELIMTEADDALLMEAFDRIEREEMGEGVHEKYHAWAHELAGK